MHTALRILVAALLVAHTTAQIESIGPDIQFNAAHNATSIAGTWSSGSKKVLTGPGFCNPASSTFTYPATAGISYSFTDDGYFEEALYRFTGNGTVSASPTGEPLLTFRRRYRPPLYCWISSVATWKPPIALEWLHCAGAIPPRWPTTGSRRLCSRFKCPAAVQPDYSFPVVADLRGPARQ
jgi:hypothetical protein